MHVLDPLSLNYRIKCFLMILQNSWKLYYDAHSDIGTKKKHDRKEIGYFHNVFKLMDVSSVKAYTGWPRKNGTVDTVDFQDFALINS